MLIRYKEQEKKGEPNTTIAVPMIVEACCAECSVWFFKNILDIVIKEAVLVRRDLADPKFYEMFSYCQFCGKRHETEHIEGQ